MAGKNNNEQLKGKPGKLLETSEKKNPSSEIKRATEKLKAETTGTLEMQRLQDQVIHSAEQLMTGKPAFEHAPNIKEFDKNLLMKLIMFAAAVLTGKPDPEKAFLENGKVEEDKKTSTNIFHDTYEGAKKIVEHISEASKKVVSTVEKIIAGEIKNKIPADCGKWAEYVYEKAGVKRREIWPVGELKDQIKVINIHGQKRTPQVEDLMNGKLPKGENEALEMVQPGDWLFYFNNNGYCKKTSVEGQHSSIFLGWIDKERRIAKMASGSGGQAGKMQKTNLLDKPITRIHRPQIA